MTTTRAPAGALAARRVLAGAALLLLVSAASAAARNPNAGPNAGPKRGPANASEAVLHVHLVPHSHDDAGWLVDVDSYYTGSGALGGVQYIISTVVQELAKDPTRRFTWVETCFLFRWWREQDEATREQVRGLVRDGRLQFAGGGWTMNDEAGTHYVAAVDNMAVGHRFLLAELGVVPTVGWQIDPFGHASTQASLFALMGFDSEYFARVDYQDKARRVADAELEMVWQPSPSLGARADIFTGVLFHHYSPPPGFCFDEKRCSDPQVVDDPNLSDYNVDERAAALATFARTQAAAVAPSRHVMLTMGDDFEYVESFSWYQNMDRLIKYFAAHPELGVDARYSSVAEYTAAVLAQNLTYKAKTDDFFPYADQPHAVWSGYFTSRPALKGYVRRMSAHLQACRHFEALGPAPGAEGGAAPGSQRLEQAVALAQHHDAVSGTSKQAVAYDYARRLAAGEAECDALMGDSLGRLGAGPGFERCTRRNESVCAATAGGAPLVLAVYNQLARPRDAAVLRVPVPSAGPWLLQNATEAAVTAQVVPAAWGPLPGRPDAQNYTLVAEVALPAAGYAVFYLTKVAAGTDGASRFTPPAAPRAATVALNNSRGVAANVSAASGLLTGLAAGGQALALQAELLWWGASDGDASSTQASGAYIFRPDDSERAGKASAAPGGPPSPGAPAPGVVRGAVVEETRTELAPWARQTVRLYRHAAYAEIEYEVGPVPVVDGVGREVVARYTAAGLATAGRWFTDSQGREMIPRRRNYRETWNYTVVEPVAGNYVPVNSIAQLGDGRRRLSVLPDRSQAGASLADGALDLMVHRRLLHDDGRGVGEALDEPGLADVGLVVRTVHRVLLSAEADAFAGARPAAEEVFGEPVVFFAPRGDATPAQWRAANAGAAGGSFFAAPGRGLPPQVHLQTVQRPTVPGAVPSRPAGGGGDAGTLLVRLAHQFAAGEGALAAPVAVNVSALFDPRVARVVNATLLGLSANQPAAAVAAGRPKLRTAGVDRRDAPPPANTDASLPMIKLAPMDIVTLNLTLAAVQA